VSSPAHLMEARSLPAATTRRLALTRERVAVLSVIAVSVLFAVITFNRWGDLWLDSGYDLVAAAKVSHANAPYIDYDYWYGPLGVLLLGVVYEVFGIGVGPAVALGLVLAFVAIGLTYAVARLLVGPAVATAVAVLAAVPAFSTSNVSYVQPHTFGGPLGVILCLVAILAIARHVQSGRRVWLLVIGVAIGLTVLTRHECFGAVAFAVGTWLLVRVARASDRRTAVAELATVVGTAVGIGAAGYGAFLIAGQFHEGLSVSQLVHRNLFPTGPMRESVSVVFAQLAPLTPRSFAKLGGMLVAYGAGIGALVLVARTIDAGGRRRMLGIAAAVAAAATVLLVLAAKPETARFYLKYVFAWMPAGSILVAATLGWIAVRRRNVAFDARAQVAFVVALLLVGFSYSVYAAYWPYPNPDFPQETAYAMPVIATFLAWVHLRGLPSLGLAQAGTLRTLGAGWLGVLAIVCAVLLVHDARKETVAISGVDGTMVTHAANAGILQEAIDIIQRETKRSEPILLAPQMTSLYVMTGRRDVLPQLSLLPGSLDGPAAEDRAIRTMDVAKLRLAIIDRTPLTRYERGPFGRDYNLRVGAWLNKNFTHISTLRGRSGGSEQPRILDVWLRRTL
jgi:hypothetical protein